MNRIENQFLSFRLSFNCLISMSNNRMEAIDNMTDPKQALVITDHLDIV